MALLRIRAPELHHRRAPRPAHRPANTHAPSRRHRPAAAASSRGGAGVEVGGEVGGEIVVQREGVHAAAGRAVGGAGAGEGEEVFVLVCHCVGGVAEAGGSGLCVFGDGVDGV